MGKITAIAKNQKPLISKGKISLDKAKIADVKFVNDDSDKKTTTPTPRQTCLEKRGFEERKKLLKYSLEKDGYTRGESYEYSARHKNAISEPTKIKGKGINSGGHTHFQPNYGKPKENPNAINYQNFLTVSDKTRSIGGKIDIDTRYESSLMRRYNYDVNEYSSKNEDALSNGDVLGKGTGLYLDTLSGGGGYDVMAREEHLMRNEWKKDLQYTRLLVNAEYEVQTEFKISSKEEDMQKAAIIAAEKKADEEFWKNYNKDMKAANKAAKKAKKEAKLAQKQNEGTVDSNGNPIKTGPAETIYQPLSAAQQEGAMMLQNMINNNTWTN